ncbi:transcription factor HES-7.1-like [Eleutherodactylus coqui]|uniref:transcription factor HES-7.1-like n=1 Tax=Eleutherodactylus coqui TaxID=57060 RepID=UPI0034630871
MTGEKEANSPPEALRKLLKPQVERRRRERINSCLEKLRVILSEAMKNEQKLKNPKMEKAEILEYTVKFLQSKMTSPESFHEDLQSMDYQCGFQQCLQATVNFITRNNQLCSSSKDFFFQKLSSTNLCRMTTRGDQTLGRLHRSLQSNSLAQSKWLNHLYTDVVNFEIQSQCLSDQICRSWRPWL